MGCSSESGRIAGTIAQSTAIDWRINTVATTWSSAGEIKGSKKHLMPGLGKKGRRQEGKQGI
jgi:hypothetical protein